MGTEEVSIRRVRRKVKEGGVDTIRKDMEG